MPGLQFPTLDSAIGTAEGFGKPGTIPTLANNPGDLIAGPFSSAHGATGTMTAVNGQQIAVFPTADAGMSAMDALIANNYAGGSVKDLGTSWLGNGDPTDWLNNVTKSLGLPDSTPVSSLAGGGSSSATGSPAPTGSGGGVLSTMAQAASDSIFGGIPWGRAAAFILGIAVIIGAIFLSKPVQQNIVQPITGAARRGVRGAAAGLVP